MAAKYCCISPTRNSSISIILIELEDVQDLDRERFQALNDEGNFPFSQIFPDLCGQADVMCWACYTTCELYQPSQDHTFASETMGPH